MNFLENLAKKGLICYFGSNVISNILFCGRLGIDAEFIKESDL